MAKKITPAPAILPDLTAKDPMEQIKALLANLTPEQRKQLLQAPKRDVAKLLVMKGQLQAFASKLMVDNFGENVDGKEALGIIWKAHWPKRYYRLHPGSDQRVKLSNGAFETWEPGGYANSKPEWVKNNEYQLYRLENGQEVEDDNGHEDSE